MADSSSAFDYDDVPSYEDLIHLEKLSSLNVAPSVLKPAANGDLSVLDDDVREFVNKSHIIIRRSYLSVPGYWLAFIVLAYITVRLSREFSVLVPQIQLNFFGHSFIVLIPFLLIFPIIILGRIYWVCNNNYLKLDKNVLTYYMGCLSLRKKTIEMETETLLVVQYSQTPIERLFNIGTLSLGRFSKNALELEYPGVRDPEDIVKRVKRRIILARKVKAKLGT